MKPIFEIIATENQETVQPVLFFCVGEKHCSFAVVNGQATQLSNLAYYTTGETGAAFLSEIKTQHPELGQSFYKVQVRYDYPHSLLLPGTGFRHEDAGQLKEILPAGTVVITEMLPEWQLYNVYAVPKEIYEWVTSHFPTAKAWHQATVALKNNNASPEGHLRADFRQFDFTLQATRDGRLLLSQTFEYSTPEDVIYYLLKTCNQFSFLQNEVGLELTGLVDKQSALYRDLYQYFVHISFRDAEWRTNNEYPAHFFTSINDISKCVS